MLQELPKVFDMTMTKDKFPDPIALQDAAAMAQGRLTDRIKTDLRSIFIPFSEESNSTGMMLRLRGAVALYLEKLLKESAIGDYCFHVDAIDGRDGREVSVEVAVEPPESNGKPEFIYIPSRIIMDGKGEGQDE